MQIRPQKILSGLVLLPASLLLIFYQILNTVTVRYSVVFISPFSTFPCYLIVNRIPIPCTGRLCEDKVISDKQISNTRRSFQGDWLYAIRIILRYNTYPIQRKWLFSNSSGFSEFSLWLRRADTTIFGSSIILWNDASCNHFF